MSYSEILWGYYASGSPWVFIHILTLVGFLLCVCVVFLKSEVYFCSGAWKAVNDPQGINRQKSLALLHPIEVDGKTPIEFGGSNN